MNILGIHLHKWTEWTPWKHAGWEHRTCIGCGFYERRRTKLEKIVIEREPNSLDYPPIPDPSTDPGVRCHA